MITAEKAKTMTTENLQWNLQDLQEVINCQNLMLAQNYRVPQEAITRYADELCYVSQELAERQEIKRHCPCCGHRL